MALNSLKARPGNSYWTCIGPASGARRYPFRLWQRRAPQQWRINQCARQDRSDFPGWTVDWGTSAGRDQCIREAPSLERKNTLILENRDRRMGLFFPKTMPGTMLGKVPNTI